MSLMFHGITDKIIHIKKETKQKIKLENILYTTNMNTANSFWYISFPKHAPILHTMPVSIRTHKNGSIKSTSC